MKLLLAAAGPEPPRSPSGLRLLTRHRVGAHGAGAPSGTRDREVPLAASAIRSILF